MSCGFSILGHLFCPQRAFILPQASQPLPLLRKVCPPLYLEVVLSRGLLSCPSSLIAKPGNYHVLGNELVQTKDGPEHLTIQNPTLLLHPLLPGSYLV